jgi:large subunit ribosomal protein L13
MKTFVLKAPQIKRQYFVLDAAGKPLGRVASRAAQVLMGKHKASYTKNLDNGDFVIIVNADKFILTGRKPKTKIYYHYSGYVGGMHDTSFKDMMRKKPLFPIEKAVKGMLPRNNLAKKMAKKLYLYAGPVHDLKNIQTSPLEI